MEEYTVNDWLTPLIKNYEHYFGKTPKPIVWEVGSRDGKDALDIAMRIYSGEPQWFWTHADITTIEANPEQVKVIKKNYPEMTVIQIAASDAKGSAPFMVYHGDEGQVGSSSLDIHWKPDLEGHQIVVDTDRLDNLIGDIPQIDIMKIDVEGKSMAVVQGLGDKLTRVKAYHIETEKWTDSDIQMKAYMMSHGYLLVDESVQYGGMPDQVWVRH